MAIDGREEEAIGKGERKEGTGIGTSMGDEEMGRQGTNDGRADADRSVCKSAQQDAPSPCRLQGWAPAHQACGTRC